MRNVTSVAHPLVSVNYREPITVDLEQVHGVVVVPLHYVASLTKAGVVEHETR